MPSLFLLLIFLLFGFTLCGSHSIQPSSLNNVDDECVSIKCTGNKCQNLLNLCSTTWYEYGNVHICGDCISDDVKGRMSYCYSLIKESLSDYNLEYDDLIFKPEMHSLVEEYKSECEQTEGDYMSLDDFIDIRHYNDNKDNENTHESYDYTSSVVTDIQDFLSTKYESITYSLDILVEAVTGFSRYVVGSLKIHPSRSHILFDSFSK